MAQPEYLSIDQVCKELQITKVDLQRLISDGDIAPVQIGGQMKFSASVVAEYKERKMEQPTITAHGVESAEPMALEEIENPDAAVFSMGADDNFLSETENPKTEAVTALEDHPDQGLALGDELGFQPGAELGEEQPSEVEEIPSATEAEPLGELPDEILSDKELTSEEHIHAAENPIRSFAQEEVQLIEEAAEQDQLGSSVSPEEQQLDISDEALGEAYLAELQKEVQEENETGELKFEVNESDGLLETGEVLSESLSKDQKLPADRDMETYFADGGEAEGISDKPQTKIVEELGFGEEAAGEAEDQIGVAHPSQIPETQEDTSSSTGGTTKILILTIVVLFLAGAGASFVLFDVMGMLGFSAKEVELQTFTPQTTFGIAALEGKITNVTNEVMAPADGVIQNLVAQDQTVESQTQIATLVQTNPEYQKLLTEKAAVEQEINNNNAQILALKTFTKTPEYAKLLKGSADLRAKRITQTVFTKTYGAINTQYAQLKRASDAATKAKLSLDAKLKAVNTKLAAIKNPTSQIAITATAAGKLVEWKVADKNKVTANTPIAIIASLDQINIAFVMPVQEAPAWKSGDTIEFQYQNQKLNLPIQQFTTTMQDNSQFAMFLTQHNNIFNDSKAVFQYAKPETAIILPTNLIENGMVWVMSEGKATQQAIATRPIWNRSDAVMVTGVNELTIIKSHPEDMKAGDAVKAKN